MKHAGGMSARDVKFSWAMLLLLFGGKYIQFGDNVMLAQFITHHLFVARLSCGEKVPL